MKNVFLILLFVFVIETNGQSKVDLEVKVQTASETARGGEPFSYVVTITNRGEQMATDVVAINEPEGFLTIASALSSRGTCEFLDTPSATRMDCEIGDLAPGETVTINFETRITDFDGPIASTIPVSPLGTPDASEINKRPFADPSTTREKASTDKKRSYKGSLGTVRVSAAEESLDPDRKSVDIFVNLLPSRNKAPQIRILAPKNDAVLTRPAKKRTDFLLTIQASDPDGTIEKVVVIDPRHSPMPVVEDGQYKFVLEGKTYTARELDDLLKTNPPPERTATRTGKDTFVYTLTDPPYGRNTVWVYAVDDGGRRSGMPISIMVKGDASVKIVSPKPSQIIAPDSPMTIEIVSKLNEGKIKDIFLVGVEMFSNEGITDYPRPELVSKEGNVYRHRYIVRSVPAYSVFSNFRAIIVEDSGAVTESETVGVLVRKVPKIVITSIKNGQNFSEGQDIHISFDATDRGNEGYRIYVDGKNKESFASGYTWGGASPGTHTIQIVAVFDDIELSRSELLTIHVK